MRKIVYLFAAVILTTFVATAMAQSSPEEKRLDEAATTIDKSGSAPQGEKMVVQRLEKDFNVGADRITALRSQKLGYGEIAIVLALAQKLPGGINDANVSKVISLRQGPPVQGWGEVAKKLGSKLGPVVSRVEKVRTETHKELEKNVTEKKEKIEKMERMEKPEKPEKMGH